MHLSFKAVAACLFCLAASGQEALQAGDYLTRTDYGEQLSGKGPTPLVWWCSSGWKIAPSRPAPETQGDTIRVTAAANETEAVQVVLRPESPITGLSWEVSPLAGPEGQSIPASAVEVLKVGYVNIERQTDAIGRPGLWPDPLPPVPPREDLEANRNHPYWIRVCVPASTPPGDYRGTLRITHEGGSRDLPLTLHVYGFQLPDTMTCVSAFGFDPGLVFRYHGVQDPAQQREVLAKYWKSFASHHISPYQPAPLDSFGVRWPDNPEALAPEALTPEFDWAAWDVEMTRAFEEHHFTSFILPNVGLGGGTFHARVEPELLGFTEDTPHYQAAFKAYWSGVEQHLRDKGWLEKSYVYWFDEPDPKDYDFVNNGFRKLKEAAPGIPRMLTEQPEPGLIGGPTLWCPISDQFNVDRACVRMTQGEKFWWYVCTGPKAPYAGEFIDHPATELRVWLWQTWQRGINGILIWQSNYWHSPEAYPDAPQNPYEDPMSWTTSYSTQKGQKLPWGNGDGRFIYPPLAAANGRPEAPVLDGPVDSIRWEMLRDGLEDYEYLAVLQRLLEEAGTTLAEAQAVAYRKLLEVPADITTDMTTFTADPAPIEQHREKVAAAIESLSAGR